MTGGLGRYGTRITTKFPIIGSDSSGGLLHVSNLQLHAAFFKEPSSRPSSMSKSISKSSLIVP